MLKMSALFLCLALPMYDNSKVMERDLLEYLQEFIILLHLLRHGKKTNINLSLKNYGKYICLYHQCHTLEMHLSNNFETV